MSKWANINVKSDVKERFDTFAKKHFERGDNNSVVITALLDKYEVEEDAD